MFIVIVQNLCHNGKWRVIYNNIGFLVCFCLIISVWHKRSYKILFINSVLFRHIICNCFINNRRCIAIIGCFLCFKLCQKFLIFLVIVGKFTACHSFLKFFLFLFVCVLRFVLHNLGFFSFQIHIRKINAPIFQLGQIPFVCEHIKIPITESVVVLNRVRSQLLNRSRLGNNLYRNIRITQLLTSTITHIAAYYNILTTVRVNEQFTQFEHLRILLNTFDEFLVLVVFDKSRIRRQTIDLTFVNL